MKKLAIVLIIATILTGCGGISRPENTATPSPAPTDSQTPTPTPAPEKTDIKDAKIEDMAVSLVKDMSIGDFEKAYVYYPYNDQMKAAISEDILRNQLWDYLIKANGSFVEVTGTVVTKQDAYDVVAVKSTFELGKLYINIVFDAKKQIAGINFSPDPEAEASKVPDGVAETELTFGESGWELKGTLTLPEGDGPFPLVILVQGSGPNDRDETVGPNKPFRDIAWSLAQKGIATFRYDKRTYVYGNKMAQMTDMTVNEETVKDAALAVTFVQNQSKVDKKRIYVLGHSLGGMMIPRIAGQTPDAAGYIIMAGPVSHLEDVIMDQNKYMSELDGKVTEEEKQAVKAADAIRKTIKTLTPDSKYTAQELFNIPVSYWLDLRDYYPAELAKSIEKPLFILQGDRDFQVNMNEFALWQQALGNRGNVALKSYEGLNHLFMYGTEKSTLDEYYVPGSIDSKVTDDLADWVLKQ